MLKTKLKKVLGGVDLWGTSEKAVATVPDFESIGKELITAVTVNKATIEKQAPFGVELKGDIHVLLVSMPSPNIDLVV
jgi:hypothetical protein